MLGFWITDSDSWSSSISAEDGSQADADTQELRTEVILGTESHDRWTVSADVPGGSAAEFECELCGTTFNGHEDAGN